MSILKSGVSALGKLMIVLSLLVAFFAGMLGIVYYQLRGEEVSIPKIVGKNFNEGKTDLSDMGLRIKKIAYRYSNEEPNTILEQRPRAGTTAKSGLMISVIVSEKNPDGNELPVEIKDDEEAIEEIQDQPELKIDKKKSKSQTKKKPKNRDVISTPKTTTPDADTDDSGTAKPSEPSTANPTTDKPSTKPPADKPAAPKPPPLPKPAVPKPKETKKPATSGDTRNRKAPKSNGREE